MTAAADPAADLAAVLTRLAERLPREPEPLRVAVLRAAARGPVRPSVVATALPAHPSAVSRQARELAGAGLVTLGTDPGDGRAWLIELTAAGQREVRRLDDARTARFARLVAGWPTADVHALTGLLRRLDAAAGAG